MRTATRIVDGTGTGVPAIIGDMGNGELGSSSRADLDGEGDARRNGDGGFAARADTGSGRSGAGVARARTRRNADAKRCRALSGVCGIVVVAEFVVGVLTGLLPSVLVSSVRHVAENGWGTGCVSRVGKVVRERNAP
jgi:hypothetical protein